MFFSAITFPHQLVEWDQKVFIKLNSEWTNPFFDAITPYLRSPICWAPFYLFLLVFVLMNYRAKGAWWVVFLLCTVALTDLTGTNVFKHVFERPRPCNDPDFYSHVRLLLNHCSPSTSYSFISNHAANHFGMATFIYITFRSILKKWTLIFFLWAILVAYSQVYVGVHYPLDVLAGALVGSVWGYLVAHIFNKQFGFAIFGNQPVE